MTYFLGIDIGTSSIKTMLVDEKGNTVDIAYRDCDVEKPKALFAEQDLKIMWNKTKETIKEIVKRYSADLIKGIGFSGQMHGLIMIDKEEKPLGKAILWCDQRSFEQTKEIYCLIGERKFKKKTLNDLSSGFLLTSLLWIKENEKNLYEKIYKVMLPKDYIRFLMCGNIGTDLSDASATLAFDTKKGQWAWSIIEKAGLEKSLFPECHESHEIAGYIHKKCAEETGLKKGTPVVFGGGDSIMQQIGNGVFSEKNFWIANIGTSCSVNCATETPIFDREFRINTFCHAMKNTWFFMGANLSGGASLKWLKNNILHMNSYDEMSALAETIEPGSNGLLFLPYLSGSRSPVNDPDAQGIFLGLTLSHTREHMIRSVMEGIVFGMKTTFSILEETGMKTERIISSGGGARSKTFLQMEADMFNRPVCIAENREQSCLGAAITAAVGVGYYKNYEEACSRMVRMESLIFYPRKNVYEKYIEHYSIYKEIYNTNRELLVKNRKLIK